MITAKEKKGLKGRSLRTISQANMEPRAMAHTETPTPMVREFSRGLNSRFQERSLASSRCQ